MGTMDSIGDLRRRPGDRSHGGASVPRPAATLVLLRDAGPEMQVLLTLRPRHLRFMGGATVFPGGAVSSSDADPRWAEASVLSPGEASDRLGEDDGARALASLVCALRESFEEVGFIAGEGPLEALDQELAGDAGVFLERCLALGVRLGTDRLVPAGRWVTPLSSPIRFDARFFLCRADPSWKPTPSPGEVDGCSWRSPAEALDELAAGRAIMAPPTVEMLQRLAAFASTDDALTALAGESLGSSRGPLAARLSPLVKVVIAPNPSLMTGPGTNTYVVGTGPTAVIDPAVADPGYLDAVVESAGPVSAILVTHRHGDHVGGIEELVRRTGAPVRAFGVEPAGGVPVAPMADGDTVATAGARLVALHTPGHAPDHLCFLLDGAASLFSGDNILGEGTSVIAPPEGDMRAYLASLERLSTIHLERIYPGHFRPLDGGDEVIEAYRGHRREREGLIVAAIRARELTLEEIVREAYRDTPSELYPLAAHSARAHLEMLQLDGRVAKNGERWSVLPSSG